MKLSNFKIKLLRTFTAAFAVASFWSCSDKVDSSNLFVFEGETVANYLEDTEGYSMFSQLTKRVKTGRKTDSRVYSLLAARGNYTVFAPSDKAVQQFIDSVYEKNNYSLDSITYEMAEYIVRNAMTIRTRKDSRQPTS